MQTNDDLSAKYSELKDNFDITELYAGNHRGLNVTIHRVAGVKQLKISGKPNEILTGTSKDVVTICNVGASIFTRDTSKYVCTSLYKFQVRVTRSGDILIGLCRNNSGEFTEIGTEVSVLVCEEFI